MTSFFEHVVAGRSASRASVIVVVDVAGALADGEAVGAVVGFGPPAVEDRQVQAAVEHGLLAAGAGGLQRARGLFSQTSTPWIRCRQTLMS